MAIVDDVKARLDIIDEISKSVQLGRSGKNYTGMCPFHANSKTPAFVVFPGSGTWRCFGSCGTGGDIIDFVMKKEGWAFSEALRYLAAKAGVEMRPLSAEEQRTQDMKRERESVLAVVMDFFIKHEMGLIRELPKQHLSAGMTYALYTRGWNLETIRNSFLGYFGQSWDALRGWLEANQVDSESPAAAAFVGYRGDVEAWAQRWGVKAAPVWVQEKKIPAMPPDMLMYAHLLHGRVGYITGRKLTPEPDRPKSWNPPAELLGDKQPFFNHVWWSERDAKAVLILEGQACGITLGEWSLPGVALLQNGMGAPNSENTSTDNYLLSELRKKAKTGARILIGLDDDEGGEQGKEKVIQALVRGGMTALQIGIVRWPAHDANDWLQNGGTAVEASALVTGAMTLLDELIDRARPLGGKSDEEAVQRLFVELARLNPFEVERVRDQVCDTLAMRRRTFDALLKAARRDAGKGDDGQDKYFLEAGRIFTRYYDSRGGETVESLCNFAAEISKDVLRDNGQDIIREFHIRGRIGKEGLPLARVKADEFSQMNWVLSQWGSRAIIEAGSRRRDQLRTAIQYLSKEVAKTTIYTHTGWREFENGHGPKRMYLTAAGAVGGESVDVELDRDLELYAVPPVANDPGQAMRLSLSYLGIASDRIAFPIYGAMFLPPLRDLVNVAFAVWLYGASGTMKSTYAALAMNHYGPLFDDKHLPANFTDTANRLEQKSFVIKDAPLLVDDFAPQKDQRSYSEYTRTAQRIVRSAGNLAGRGRLSADSTAKSTYEPRGLTIITGEDLPESESIVARTFVVEFERGDVDKAKLTALQGQRGRLCHGMSGYLAWVGQNWARLETSLPEKWLGYRNQAFDAGYHLRVPEAVAGLMVGIETVMEYATVMKALDTTQASELVERGWLALTEGAKNMVRRVREEKPELLFLRTLTDLLTQGKVYLKPCNGLSGPLGGDTASEMLGWYDHDRLYLLPEATYSRIAKYFREQGNIFPVRETTLRKMLAEEGAIETKDGRKTLVVTLDGNNRRVMVLRRNFLKKSLKNLLMGRTDKEGYRK